MGEASKCAEGSERMGKGIRGSFTETIICGLYLEEWQVSERQRRKALQAAGTVHGQAVGKLRSLSGVAGTQFI